MDINRGIVSSRCMIARALAGGARGVVRGARREGGSIIGRRAIAATAMRGRFADVPEAPKDPILGISEMFLADSHPEKMNLGVVRVDDAGREGASTREDEDARGRGRCEGDARCVIERGGVARERMID